MYYVRINRLNGRNDFYDLVKRLNEHGYDRVEYFSSTQYDDYDSHLRFVLEGDAVAYCLAHGTTYSTNIPGKI